jgi:uncharacterized protein YbcI
MAGFDFRYRLSGGRPTVRGFASADGLILTRGDILNWENGRVEFGVPGDIALLGAALGSQDGESAETIIEVITDADAVYGVHDPHSRLQGDHLDLDGLTGAHGVIPDASSQLAVVLDCNADEETLVRITVECHHRVEANADGRLVGGELNAAVARMVVRYHNQQLGRGPTRARAFYRDNVMIVMLEDAMTKAERSLAASGKADVVHQLREAFQQSMRADLVATVEELTGCKVEAFMSANHLDPDCAAEIFVLDRPVPGESGDSVEL